MDSGSSGFFSGSSGYLVAAILFFLLAVLMFVAAGLLKNDRKVPAPPPLPADLQARVRVLLGRRKPIQAVKEVREATGLGLAEAKAAVDALKSGPLPEPPAPYGPGGPGPVSYGPGGDGAGAHGPGAHGPGGYASGAPGSGPHGPGAPGAAPYGAPPESGPPAAGPTARTPGPSDPGGGSVAERARSLRDSGDFDGAVTLVQEATGMSRPEAERFVAALG